VRQELGGGGIRGGKDAGDVLNKKRSGGDDHSIWEPDGRREEEATNTQPHPTPTPKNQTKIFP